MVGRKQTGHLSLSVFVRMATAGGPGSGPFEFLVWIAWKYSLPFECCINCLTLWFSSVICILSILIRVRHLLELISAQPSGGRLESLAWMLLISHQFLVCFLIFFFFAFWFFNGFYSKFYDSFLCSKGFIFFLYDFFTCTLRKRGYATFPQLTRKKISKY